MMNPNIKGDELIVKPLMEDGKKRRMVERDRDDPANICNKKRLYDSLDLIC